METPEIYSDIDIRWRMETITDDRIVFSLLDYFNCPYKLYYTKNFKTYYEIKNSTGDYDRGYKDYCPGLGLLRKELSNDSFKMYLSNDYKTWNVFFAEFSSDIEYWHSCIGEDGFIFIHVERQTDNSLFAYSKDQKSFVFLH